MRNRYNQVLYLAQNTIWESNTNTRKHNMQESHEVSPFPAGDHKAARNRQYSITKGSVLYKNYKQGSTKKERLRTVSKKQQQKNNNNKKHWKYLNYML